MSAVLATGDLVKIVDHAFKYFANQLAVVDHVAMRSEYYDDDGVIQERTYYLVTLSGTDHSHVFPEDHLEVVSKANKNNE